MTLRPSGRAMFVGFMIALSLAAVASAGDSGRATGTYVSKRFHYSLRVPAGFKTVPATSNALPAFYPTGESIAADRFVHGAYKIVIDSTPTAQTLAAWT